MPESLTKGDYARLAAFPAAVLALLIGSAITGSKLNGQPPEQLPAVTTPPGQYPAPAPQP